MRKFFSMIFGMLALWFNAFSQTADFVAAERVDSLGNWYTGATVHKPEIKLTAFIMPAALIGYGVAAVNDYGELKQLDLKVKSKILKNCPLFSTRIDDYLQYTPAVAVYALNLLNVKGKHNLFDATMLYVTSSTIGGVSTHLVKRGVGRTRPNGSGNNSFSSGHTAYAFTSAEFLYQEYKDVNAWIGYAGYLAATTVGTLRIYNNKHWLSDVVAGAGFGIASTKIAYLIYPFIKRQFAGKKQNNFIMLPFYGQALKGITIFGNF